MVSAYASLPHYWSHLAPIVAALPSGDDRRSRVWADHGSRPWGERLPRSHRFDGELVLVASWPDADLLHRRRHGARLVYVEHGAGQTYRDRAGHPAFSGGGRMHRDSGIVAYLAPSETVAARWRAARPDVPVGVVGCPRLDPLRSLAPPARTVAITFHWPNTLCPESMWALPSWRSELRSVVGAWRRAGWEVLGHGHPKAWGALAQVWKALDVEAVADVDELAARAFVLVADNTSLLYEWAALGRPVAVMNAPTYRRCVEHGLRFWSDVPGPQLDSPADARALDLDALAGDEVWAEVRAGIVGRVYAHVDGSAARRAAEFITALEEAHAP